MVNKKCEVTKFDWVDYLTKVNDSGITDYKLSDMTGIPRATITKLRLGNTGDAKFSDGLAIMKAVKLIKSR